MALGEPRPDALTIAGKVQALGRHEVAWPESRAFLAPDCAAWLDDSEIILRAMHFDLTVEVACFARLGMRPDWGADRWRVWRLIGSNGKVRVEGAVAGRRRYLPGAHCPLAVDPDPRQVVAGRAQYAAWRLGLCRLADSLANQLQDWHALAPTAAVQPWLTGENPPPRILPDMRIPKASVPARRARSRRGGLTRGYVGA